MGPRSRAFRVSDARAWLRSRGPVTLAAALLLEISSATVPGSSRVSALLRAVVLLLALTAVLVLALVDGILDRVASWMRDLWAAASRGALTAYAWSARTVPGRMAAVRARVAPLAGPIAMPVGRALLAAERRFIAARAALLGTVDRVVVPRVARTAGLARARTAAVASSAGARLAGASAPLRARAADGAAALPARAERALRRARALAAIGARSTGRVLAAIPVPAVPLPSVPLRTVRVVTSALVLSFVFATVIGTTGLVASRGSIALGASTTLTVISGEVLVSDPESAAFRVAADGEILQAGSTIKTGPDAYAVLTYFEGSTVSIDPDTILVIETLLANPDGSTVIGMRQDVGQTWHAVTKLLTAGSKYDVRTPTATATVRGTLFLVGVVPGQTPGVLDTIIETTEGAVAAGREPTDDAPDGEEIVVPAGFQVRAAPAAPIPPPVPAPEPERTVTVTVAAPNSLVVDPQGRANGEKDGKIVVQTPGAKVEKVDGQIVVTLPNTTDGNISTVVDPPGGDAPPAPVQVITVVQERGRGETRSEETVQPTTVPVVTGVELRRGTDETAPPQLRRLEESEKGDLPKGKVAGAPPEAVEALARIRGTRDREERSGGSDGPGTGGGEESAPSGPGAAGSILTLRIPPLSAEELAQREAEQRARDERDRRERQRQDEERVREEERKVEEARRAEQQARDQAARQQSERAQKEAEAAADERRKAEQRLREQAIRAEEQKKRDAERRAEELRRQEERARQEAARRLEELRRIEEKAREQAAKLETEQRREAEKRLGEFRQNEERKTGEDTRALEERRRAEERQQGDAQRRIEELRREEQQARERERERERDRERGGFAPTETLKPLPRGGG